MPLLAHLDKETGREQTLAEHAMEVGGNCAGTCGAIGLPSLGMLVGLLHDMGKASDAFQEYLREPSPAMRGKINHSSCGARFLQDEFGLDTTLSGLTATLAAAAVCGHHSGLPDCTSLRGEDLLYHRIFPEKEIWYHRAAEAFLQECVPKAELCSWYHKAEAEVGRFYERLYRFSVSLPDKIQQEQRAFYLGLTARFLESALVDADRYDTYCFYAEQAKEKSRDICGLWERLSGRLEEHLAGLPGDTPMNRVRKRISEACRAFASHGPGVYQLQVPTGGGKTLSSFRFALHTALKAGRRVDHIYYIAPFRTILEQNASELREIFREDAVVLEHHGNALMECKDEGEEMSRIQLLAQRWDAPVIFTTLVQFLQTLFSGRQSCTRRFHALQNSVILLDEIQSVPVKFVSMLNSALNFLSEFCGCTVILCTATQPELEKVSVPVKLSSPAAMVPRELTTFEGFERTRLVDNSTWPPMDAPQLAAFVAQQQAGAGSVLVILNTKTAALRLFDALERETAGRCACYYLTTGLCPANRLEVLSSIRVALEHKRPLICVSTQLIEAGVDISFGCVVRSLAGLDSIAQAAGRCNRHGEQECANVFIIKSADENLARLPDIQKGQNAAIPVLNAYRCNPARFAGSLLSPTAIGEYYRHYYHDRAWELDYPVNREVYCGVPPDTTLYSLLSVNREAVRAVGYENLPRHSLHQAFATAGHIFEVFDDSSGVDVIVPYAQGRELIASLGRQDLPYREIPLLLRRAQRYLVRLYEYEKRFLEDQGALYRVGEGKLLALNERYYSERLGLRLERGEMDALLR